MNKLSQKALDKLKEAFEEAAHEVINGASGASMVVITANFAMDIRIGLGGLGINIQMNGIPKPAAPAEELGPADIDAVIKKAQDELKKRRDNGEDKPEPK